MSVTDVERAKTRRVKAQEIVAYLSYALADVRSLSPTSSYFLEISIAAIKDDMQLQHKPLLQVQREYS
jgi:hypothetical protein